MSTLYLIEQGSSLRHESQRLVVEKDSERLLEVPEFKVDAVLIFGNVTVTTPAVGFLLGKGIDVSFLSMRGRLKGRLVSMESKNVVLRVAQFERQRDDAFKRRVATAIITAKIRNARNVLMRFARNHPEADFSADLQVMERAMGSLERKENLKTLMGAEGLATKAYFSGFSKMFLKRADGFSFERRARRPPTDPVNALLSFGYSLIGNEITAQVAAAGFDPFIGFYHGINYGRPSLALDLVEEFRHPVVDRFVLYLVNNRLLRPEDFETDPEGGVRLKTEPLKTFLRQYEKRMLAKFQHPVTAESITYRRLFHDQVMKMAKAVKENGEYEPYVVGK